MAQMLVFKRPETFCFGEVHLSRLAAGPLAPRLFHSHSQFARPAFFFKSSFELNSHRRFVKQWLRVEWLPQEVHFFGPQNLYVFFIFLAPKSCPETGPSSGH